MSRIRVGFVGLGSMGQCAHLANYAVLADCEVAAVAELREDLGRQVARRYGVPRVHRSHREMLASERLDALVAIQRFETHGQLLPELLEAGLPVLIEKPLARSVEVGERLLEESQRTGTPLFVGYHKRSDPAVMAAMAQREDWDSSGRMGRPRFARITMPPGEWIAGGFDPLIRTAEPYPALAADPPPSGMDEEDVKRHDAFVNYYIHQLNLLRYFLGEGYDVVHADRAGRLLVVESASGVPAVIEMAPWETSVDWQESALLAYDRGWMRVDLPPPLAVNRAGRLTVYEDPADGTPPREIRPTLPSVHAMRQQAIHFLAAVRGERTPLCRAEEAVEDLRTARRCLDLLAA